MMPHRSIWVVKRLSDMRTDPILGCFDDLEGLN
jgi:hypothetical protein